MAGATIYDVSKRAGVSIATVSRVLNRRDTVSLETRARVLEAIDELGFVPKLEAVTRARKEMGRIGVLTPSIVDSIVDRLRGILDALADQPYEPVIYNIGSAAQLEGYLTNLALTRTVDGLIIIGMPVSEAAAQRLRIGRIPVAQFADTHTSYIPTMNHILLDHGEGGRVAAEYLLEMGHRRLGFIGDAYLPNYADGLANAKLDYFRQTLAKAGVALPNSYVGLTRLDMDEAQEKAYRLLDLPEPPTAIFAASDNLAIAVISAARERGLSVPGDLAVMGYDDISIAKFVGLTTIRQPLKESGRWAVEILLSQIENYEYPNQKVMRNVELVRRFTA
ncbi:MAG: LacI family DNA-binding transcriptional regulator [Chloroflexi bacterium]|nr:LacI family DNA-binding transcriptional regulator [Chloroflexota bacterium]OJV90142.1 MAG: hypothetical protein BGO39_01910 [Chloroflexi bacterium 54-19]